MSAAVNSLLGSLVSGASTARAQSAKAETSGQFSQLLRSYEKPPESPKPPAESSPAHAAAPPKPENKAEGKTETQRQEARSAAPKKSSVPAAKGVTETPTAATPVPPGGTASEAGEAAGAATKTTTSSTSPDDAAPKDQVASADSATAALLAQAQAPAMPLTLPMGALGTPGAAKPPGSERAPDDAATAGDGNTGPQAAVGTSTGTGTPLGRAARAAADNLKARAGEASAHDSAAKNSTAAVSTDVANAFATALADAVQAQPAALRSAEAGPRAQAGGTAAMDAVAGAGAQAVQPGLNPASTDSGSPAGVHVASPLYTPGFAPEMAARLSLLAADGVQTAQLHLNPADMGPVAVQIVVEGQQARIEFQADQADTRAVLERSLPDLAAALRDAGLTLSGGGVFQQFPGQGQSEAQARSEGSALRHSVRAVGNTLDDALSALPPHATAGARQTQGVVDLYA